jgi:cytochrome c
MRSLARSIFLLSLCSFLLSACSKTWDTPPRLLIFSKTTGFRHQSIEAGKDALVKICYENGILADTTENADFFEEKNLKRYAAVVFLNTNGEVLNPRQEADFERYIQAGGGFVGVHSASATEYTWRWYGGLVGGYFKDHPHIQEVDLEVENCEDISTKHLACQPWTWKEELYNFRNYEPDIRVLLTVDENTYKGGSSPTPNSQLPTPRPNGMAGRANPNHPLSWRHEYDGGRAFYTALGHIPEAYSDPDFQKHLLGGLLYAIGENCPLNYGRCRTQRAPDPTRFVKTVIASDLQEPMEIAQLPDGKIILIERHGQIKLFNPETGLLNTVTKLPVYSEMGDGLIGLQIDPNWEKNHWIYLYYSSLRDSMNQLSRFVFQGDTLVRASEKVLLAVPVGRKNCFHAAGSMEFDEQGNLFLATGDNTSPFASDGFAPIDERPGRQAFDAQRSSANTRDLRGKILRIKPLNDDSYICPGGNLFNPLPTFPIRADGLPRHFVEGLFGSPEIYIMGCRNPFRISYDERRKFLFWGDIGSDAGKADTARGPLGHDEINRAREAGNFGWPYFTGDNQAYRDYDFSEKKPGPYFDPQKPLNESPNNTGAQELPPAQPAFIWYPYSKNRDFPVLGSGGRNAMAGPVYYCDKYPAATRFPNYYDGKLIIYDWMRNWLMAVTLDSLGNFHRLEPMADSMKLSRPMDMLIDRKTGSLWVLEYGTRWYSSNEDARLSRIDFVRGNRPPISVLEANKTAGAAPCQVVFSFSKSKDYDGGKLNFEMDFGDYSPAVHGSFDPAHLPGGSKNVRGQKTRARRNGADSIAHIFQKTGIYEITLKITDEAGASAVSKLKIHIGNEPPLVRWDLGGRNRSFYRPGDTLRYRLIVNDLEDGSWENGGIAPDAIATSVDYLEKGIDPSKLGKQVAANAPPEKFAEGKRLVEQSDCKSCHALDKQMNGPAFQAIAERYRNNVAFAVQGIYRKIIYGGAGNWGQSYMTPHPQIREEEAIQMSLWILSLGDPPKPVQSLPLQGKFVLKEANGAYVFKANYRDRGAQGFLSLENGETLVLRPATIQAEKCDTRSEGVGNYKPFDNDTTVLNELKHNAYFAVRQVDLAEVRSLILRIGYGDKRHPCAGGRLEIRAGSPSGNLLGETKFEMKNGERMAFEERKITLLASERLTSLHDLFFVFKNEENQGRGVVATDWVRFDF